LRAVPAYFTEVALTGPGSAGLFLKDVPVQLNRDDATKTLLFVFGKDFLGLPVASKGSLARFSGHRFCHRGRTLLKAAAGAVVGWDIG
jgi:hypothetical protein